MGRFVAGAVAALLLSAAGLFWYQGRAEQERPAPVGMGGKGPADLSLPLGDPNARGAPPPMPPEARPEDREARRFARYDRDGDGRITRLEMMSTRTAAFKALDKDGNNLLSFEEWAVRTSDKFAKADADGDTRLTPQEFATTASKPAAKPKCGC